VALSSRSFLCLKTILETCGNNLRTRAKDRRFQMEVEGSQAPSGAFVNHFRRALGLPSGMITAASSKTASREAFPPGAPSASGTPGGRGGGSAVSRPRRRCGVLRLLFLRRFAGASSVGGAEPLAEGVSRKASHHSRAVLFSSRVFANETEVRTWRPQNRACRPGRRDAAGGIRCSEGCNARIPRS